MYYFGQVVAFLVQGQLWLHAHPVELVVADVLALSLCLGTWTLFLIRR